MTVSTTDSVETYVSGGPAFTIPYRFLQNSDIVAELIKPDGSTETLTGAQYTLTGAGAQSGGTLTSVYAASVLAAPPGATLVISRDMVAVQPTDLRNQGKFLAETHETVFDRLTMLIQQGLNLLGRALVRPFGKNYYDAKGFRIANVADPSAQQDAVTKQHLETYVAQIISTGTGPINLASNVLYIGPDGITRTVQDMSGAGSATSGAGLIGYGDGNAYAANTVGGKVQAIDAELDTTTIALQGQIDSLRNSLHNPAIIANNSLATAINVSNLGDSISHGAYARNIFMHGWPRILQRMINAELGISGYGFAPWETLGFGTPLQSVEIHDIAFGGTWTGIPADSANAAVSFTGTAIRSSVATNTMQMIVPFFQNRCQINYLQQPGGATFTVSVNGVVAATTNSNGTLQQASVEVALSDASYGSTTILITQTTAGLLDIVGPSYLAAAVEPVFNNWAQSGRRLRYMSQAVIQSICATSSTLIMSLGHNDQVDADTDTTYFAEFSQRITWLIQYARLSNAKVIVPDFCWIAPESSRARAQLVRLANETGGIYINLPKMIFSGATTPSWDYLINTLKMWDDGSHPNIAGQKWIAETIARAMGLSCSSKRDAIRLHDYWMPLPLKGATGVENGQLSTAALTSSYKRNGNEVLVKLFVEETPTGAFPVGTYSLTDAFNSKSELSLAQGQTGLAYVRNDTGAAISGYSIASGGALTLNVYTSFINEQIFSFSSPIAPGTL